MQWTNASEFFAMGGYGLYVWGSFGVCFAHHDGRTRCWYAIAANRRYAKFNRATMPKVLTRQTREMT